MFSVNVAILQRFNADACTRVTFSENHDEVAAINHKVRLPEAIDPGHADSWFAKRRTTLGVVLTFTSPAIPMIFMGMEFVFWRSWQDNVPMD